MINKKFRETVFDPLKLTFDNIKITKITGYMPAGNDVVEAVLDDGSYVYIKMERSKVACFDVEYNNIKLLREKKLYNLIPEIIEYKRYDNKDIIVLKKIEGKKLSSIFKNIKSKSIKHKYLYKYGLELARIHKIDKSGFPKAKQRVINEIPNKETYQDFDDNIKPYISYLEKYDFNKTYDTFIHGDFHYGNILWRYGRINGIIDYEYSGKGLKEQDIAWSIILRPGQKFMDNIDDVNVFLAGYKNIGRFDINKLRWCLINGYVHFYLMNQNNEEYKNNILKLLKETELI